MATDAVFDAGKGEPAWPADAVEVGRIHGAWGIKGWFKVQAYAADPQALYSSRRWFLRPSEDVRTGVRPLPSLLKITHAREHGDGLVAAAQEIADREAAEALQGARVFVPRASFPTAAPDEYYWVDLIGCDVFNRRGEALGKVTDLIDTGPHAVLRLKAPGGAIGDDERLIPFVSAYVDTVDIVARRIVVDWGLDY